MAGFYTFEMRQEGKQDSIGLKYNIVSVTFFHLLSFSLPVCFKFAQVIQAEFHCGVTKFLDCEVWLCGTNAIIILTRPLADSSPL